MRLSIRAIAVLVVLSMSLPLATVQAVDGSRFGAGNLPPGCDGKATAGPAFTDSCYHMRTNLNYLDTPIIDVLLVPPVTPHAERDLRTMRQSIQMLDQGFHYLAPQMGLDWMEDVKFNILVDDGKLTTDPAWDPEIVVLVVNPALTVVQGIGIDPLGAQGPCRGANPLATFEDWAGLSGFDNHHGGSSGTYTEPCQGGGTTCYAINVAIDPVPGYVDNVLNMNLFDLVAHEVGHCLSMGHVGDALDHTAASVPTADIMSYTGQPHFKCVSSLDVEAFALRMSRFLLPAPLVANHRDGPGGQFQVQHPRDHFYASSSGLAVDCPQPDAGLVPFNERASFTPTGGIQRSPAALRITSHADHDHVAAGLVDIAGTVSYGSDPATDRDGDQVPDSVDNCPDAFNPNQRDHDQDGIGDACDSMDGNIPVPDGSIRGGITMFSKLNPALAHNELLATGTGATGDPRPRFLGGEPVEFNSRFTTAPAGLVTVNVTRFTWHVWSADGTVVATAGCRTKSDSTALSSGFNCVGNVTLPTTPGVYFASALLENSSLWITDTPQDDLERPGLKGFEVVPVSLAAGAVPASSAATSVHFTDSGTPANTFYPEESTFGVTQRVGYDTSEVFTLDVPAATELKVRLEWKSRYGYDDLNLEVSGVVSNKSARTTTTFEELVFKNVPAGTITIRVVPFEVNDPVGGTKYTLVATYTEPQEPPADSDGDGVHDGIDACPGTPAGTPVDATGCALPPPAVERVEVSVDGVVQATVLVDGRGGDAWSAPVDLSGRSGPVTVRAAWYDGDWLVREQLITLVVE